VAATPTIHTGLPPIATKAETLDRVGDHDRGRIYPSRNGGLAATLRLLNTCNRSDVSPCLLGSLMRISSILAQCLDLATDTPSMRRSRPRAEGGADSLGVRLVGGVWVYL